MTVPRPGPRAEPAAAPPPPIVLTRVVVVVVALLLLGELFARAFLTSPLRQNYDPELGYVNEPLARSYNAAEGGARLTFNSLGLNDDEVDPDADNVLVLGDSITEALEVPAEANFTSVAERRIGRPVVNAGRNALAPFHYPLVYDRLASAVRPTHVVLCLHSGDYWDLTSDDHDITLVWNEAGELDHIETHVAESSRLKRLLEPLTGNSALAIYLLRRYKPLVETWLANEPDAAPASPADLLEERRLRRKKVQWVLDQLIDRVGGPEHLSILFLRTGVSDAERPRASESQVVIREVAAELGVRLVDVSDELDRSFRRTGQPPFGFHNFRMGDGHLNRRGHRVVGEALGDLLASAPTR